MDFGGNLSRNIPQNLLCAEVTRLADPGMLQTRLDAVNRDLGSSSMRLLHHRRITALREELGVGRSGSVVSLGLTHSGMVLAADQRVVDGLGLLAVLSRVSGHPVSAAVDVWPALPRPSPAPAAGPAAVPTGHGIRRTPAHVARAHYRDDLLQDVFAAIRLRKPVQTSQLLSAVARATRDYNARRGTAIAELDVSLSGFVSDGAAPEVGSHSTLLRVPGLTRFAPGAINERLRHAPREPVDEVSRTKEHTSTLLVARLGSLECPATVRSVEFFPAVGMGFGVGVGATTQGEHTILTARSRASRYTPAGLEELLELVRNALL